jgi:DNA-binding LacI/PurR family transcriptional regulator
VRATRESGGVTSIVDVAGQAGAPASTAPQVVNGARRVAFAAVEAALEAVDAVGRRPNGGARALESATAQTGGVAIPRGARRTIPIEAKPMARESRAKPP